MPTVVLIVGLVLNALVAGLYFGFTTAVMPALLRTDARSYVTSMQRISESILNPWFLTAFLGALVVPAAAVFLHLDDDSRRRLPWIVAGTVLYGTTILTTGFVNIPLNNRLEAAGDVSDQAAPAVRAAFHRRWTRFNTVRTVLGTAAVIALAVALSQPTG
jgi:uncharacterized membrane protein